MNVRRVDRGHLPPLNLTGAAIGIEDEDVGVAAVPHAVDRRRPGVARGCPDDRDVLVVSSQYVLEQPPDELQSDVFERQGRAVEQLLHEVVVADLDQRGDRGMGERAVGVDAHRRQVGRCDVVAHEQLHDLGGALRVAHAVDVRR